jgi:hypothetical protein
VPEPPTTTIALGVLSAASSVARHIDSTLPAGKSYEYHAEKGEPGQLFTPVVSILTRIFPEFVGDGWELTASKVPVKVDACAPASKLLSATLPMIDRIFFHSYSSLRIKFSSRHVILHVPKGTSGFLEFVATRRYRFHANSAQQATPFRALRHTATVDSGALMPVELMFYPPVVRRTAAHRQVSNPTHG